MRNGLVKNLPILETDGRFCDVLDQTDKGESSIYDEFVKSAFMDRLYLLSLFLHNLSNCGNIK